MNASPLKSASVVTDDPAPPSFPAIANAILRLAAREDVTLEEVAEVIAADSAIAAEVLRMANSASMGVRGEVRSIAQASTLLGLKRLSSIGASVAMRTSLGSLWKKSVVRQCWQHNLACALSSEQMARWLQLEPQTAYTAGLLHDIGRLGLLMRHQDGYATFLLHAPPGDPAEALAAERAQFGSDHTTLGLAMIDALGLPDSFCQVASRHHDAPEGESTELVPFIHVACELASAMGFGVRASRDEPRPPADLDTILAGLPPKAREELTRRHPQLVDVVTSMVEAYARALS